MKRRFIIITIVLSIFFVSPLFLHAQQRNTEKQIKVIVKVETEDQGIRLPTEKPLSALETERLRSLIIGGLNKLQNIKVVSPDEKDDAIGILVVAEKLFNNKEYIILSSTLTLSKANGQEYFITHNVLADPNLKMAAEAVVVQFVSAELYFSK